MKRKFSRLLPVMLVFVMIFSTSVIAYASDKTAPYGNIELEDAYSRIVTYANENNIELGMTYDDFRNGYAGQSISEYENSYYSVLLPSPTVATCSSSSGGGRKYYYNTKQKGALVLRDISL